jgi:tetratricopeptide (TPR) repeat protein
MSAQEAEEEDDTSDDRPAHAEEDDEDEDEHDHTPPSSAEVRRHSTSIIRLDQVEADRPRKVADVATDDAPRLLVLTPDELKGQEFACIRTELRIGRTDDNDITLDHRSLSRTHAKLVREEGGEWRVIDMQSANGLTVNGESYAQATLNSGDIIELGHVKLRFLHAGDAADDLPAGEGGSRSKLPLVAGLAALLLGAGAVGFYFFRPPVPGTPVPPVAQPGPDTEPPSAEPQPTPGTEPDTAVAQPAPEAPPAAPPAPTGPSLPERLALAQKAITAHEFDKAEDYLSSVKDAQGRQPKEVVELLDQARAERMVKQRLDRASTALAAGKLADAEKALSETSGTKVFASEASTLAAQLADAQLADAQKKAAAAAAAATPPPAVNTNTVPPPGTARPPAGELSPAEQALVEGKKYIQTKNYPLAIENLRRCIELDANTVDCYAFLGSALARNEQSAEGAEYYRRFLKLAPPDHPRFKAVKDIVESYEKKK